MKLSKDDFSSVDLNQLAELKGWQAQYKAIIGYGRCITPKPWVRLDKNRLVGCELPTWLEVVKEGDSYWYHFDCDSRVINGFVALMLSAIQGRPRTFDSHAELLTPLAQLGIERHVTPSRNNGLLAIAIAIEQSTREL